MDREARRRLLIALNEHPRLSRDAVCRLALATEIWAGPEAAATSERARTLQLPLPVLEDAISLLPRADALGAAAIERAAARGWSVLVDGDDHYPAALHDLPLPPPVLYALGRLPRRPAIAIVGSRNADAYGLEAADLFAAGLARAGLAVVSGLARGVDTAAHHAAIRDASGRTIAVLGCGLDFDYPRGSARLRRRIEHQGAVISEFGPGTPALPFHFPIRNRIIAALGLQCLVIQAAPRSGSLVTARHALELGREVWALPGRVFDRRSVGANLLIRDGASPALDPMQLLEALPLATRERLRPAAVGDPEPATGSARSRRGTGRAAAVLAGMEPGDPVTAEELARRSGEGIERVLAALFELELEGRVGRLPGSRYVRRASGARL